MKQGAQKIITLISVVCFVLMIDDSLAQGKAKFSLRRFAAPQRFTARIIFQTRRLRIVKCCGRESCLLPGRLRNGSGQPYTKPTRNKWNIKRRPSRQTKIDSFSVTIADVSNPEAENPITTITSEIQETPVSTAAELEPTTDSIVAAEIETSTAPAIGYTGVTADENGDYGVAATPTSTSSSEPVPTQTNNGLTSPPGSNPSTSSPQTGASTLETAAQSFASSSSGPVSATSPTSSNTKAANEITNSTTLSLNTTTATLTSLKSSSSTSTSATTKFASSSAAGTSSTLSSTATPMASSTSASTTSTSANGSTETNHTSTTTSTSTSTSSSTTTTSKSPTTATTTQSNTTVVTTTTPNSTITVIPKSNPCMDDGCVMSCVKDPALFPGGVLTVPSTRGTFATICTKKYFMSIERTNQSVARQSCCAMGMTLSSIETRAEQDCITKYNDDVSKTLAIYWVAATDKSCLKNFTWCTGSQLDVATYDWIISQPNFKGNQSCMVHVTDFGHTVPFLGFVKGDNGLNDWECYDTNEYLCEATP